MIQVAACSLIFRQAAQGYGAGIAAQSGYGLAHIIILIVLILFSTISIIIDRKPWLLLIIMLTCLTLPIMEQLKVNVSAYLYIVVAILWLARIIRMTSRWIGEIRSYIPALSVKNAIDSLCSGVMFCEEGGFALLTNAQMRWLAYVITGNRLKNGRQFYGRLALGNIRPGCKTSWFEGHEVCLLPDGSAWMFNMTGLKINSRRYIEITATDITERWEQCAGARAPEREDPHSETGARDMPAGRLALAQLAARSELLSCHALLRVLSQALLDELTATGSGFTPHEELKYKKNEISY